MAQRKVSDAEHAWEHIADAVDRLELLQRAIEFFPEVPDGKHEKQWLETLDAHDRNGIENIAKLMADWQLWLGHNLAIAAKEAEEFRQSTTH